MPADWPELVERYVAVWRHLDAHEQATMAEIMAAVIDGPRWEAARGFELDDRIRVVVAAQVALLLLGLDPEVDWLAGVGTIVVHPTTMRGRYRRDPGPVDGTETCGIVHLDGETMYRGPVAVAWDAASAAARHPGRGVDVVLHEFAHVLDMADGVVDGTPPLPADLASDWIAVCTDAYERLQAHGSDVLDDYGAQDPGEFFAVATEAFFTVPTHLEDDEPALYDVLRRFYGQDPATRHRRAR